MPTLQKTLLSLMVFAVGASPLWAEESYYMIMLASQRPDNQPKYSHTFAAFVKVTEISGKKAALETAMISWLPATGVIDLARILPEPGKNFGLKETLDWAAKLEAPVTAWGPYRIKKDLFDSSRRQSKRLEGGTVAYKAIDLGRLTGSETVTNCIHAVCDLDIAKERLVTGIARGEEASVMVARFLRPWIIRPEVTHRWLADRLSLEKSKITFRDLD